MPKPICRSLPLLGALGLCLTAGACKEDPPTPKLFEEEGVWSVISYDIEGLGQLTDININNRLDSFLLHFDTAERVVTTAACIEPGANESPADSPCLVSSSTTAWDCRCFGYDFVEDQQLWREFNAGDLPPTVSLSDLDMPAGGGTGTGGGSGGGETGGDVLVTVAEIMGVGSTFNFRPMPLGVFDSNGDNSRYVLQARANSIFDKVYEDPDGRPSCSPCVQ